MGYAVTLQELRTRAVRRADMWTQLGPAAVLTLDQVNSYINESISELHDLLMLRYSGYYRRVAQLTLVAGQGTYDLPDDFLKLLAVVPAGSCNALEEFMYTERSRGDSSCMKYGLLGQQIALRPVPTGALSLQIEYIPQATRLVNDNDKLEMQVVNGWEEYIVVDTAIKCKEQIDLDTSKLMARKQALYQRILAAASSRGAGGPQRVVDTGKVY